MIRGTVLLLGAGGMLGSTFRALCPDVAFQTLSRGELDVSSPRVLLDRIVGLAPTVIINCAADTNVDRAEADPADAFAVNAVLPGLVAQAARQVNALLVHFSSTGCYGRHQDGDLLPHSDFEAVFPTTAHHRSKVAGELAVREAGCRHLILRLGWLYGGSITHKKNFVWARIRDARSKPELASDPFQTGSPTLVDDVVRQTLVLLEVGVVGTFNCVATGAVSRFDYVARIMELAGLSSHLRPARFKRAASVAENEAAVNDKLALMGLNIMPLWDEALAGYVMRLLAEEAESI
ncbi:SDR family oxidoreductase [Gluconacetobacter azotocaptans]|nr:sugar nucleotide-binding protein [Gluconacetobacter azotocaptans]